MLMESMLCHTDIEVFAKHIHQLRLDSRCSIRWRWAAWPMSTSTDGIFAMYLVSLRLRRWFTAHFNRFSFDTPVELKWFKVISLAIPAHVKINDRHESCPIMLFKSSHLRHNILFRVKFCTTEKSLPDRISKILTTETVNSKPVL